MITLLHLCIVMRFLALCSLINLIFIHLTTGSSKQVDLNKLNDNMPYILVATPGRLIDHMKSSRVNGVPFSEIISNVSVWVLDEADRCLDMVRSLSLFLSPSCTGCVDHVPID